MPSMEEAKEVQCEGCPQCEDSVDPSALAAAVRHVRKELNANLDEIEAAALAAQSIERRVTGL